VKKIVAVLLVAALAFGFGATLVHAVDLGPSVVADGPGYPEPEPPPQWPPVQNVVPNG
jgi:hypothetical protein